MKKHKYDYNKIKNPGNAIVTCVGVYLTAPITFPSFLTLLLVLRPTVLATYYLLLGISVLVREFRPNFPAVDRIFYDQLMESCRKAEKFILFFLKWLFQCMVFFAGYMWWGIGKAANRITELYNNHQKKKPLIFLQQSNQPPVYTGIFSFLTEYFEAFYIPPGNFKLDEFGILHILIRVERPIKNGLEYLEFSNILRLRTIHALSNAEEFSAIPPSYWAEDTVFFPKVRENLLQHRLVVYIATTAEGRERIQQLSTQTKRPVDDLNETIK